MNLIITMFQYPFIQRALIVGVLVSICAALLGVCLKTGFNFSKRQVAETLEWIRYYINSLATGYETMTGIASVMEQECKYCDPRFIGKTYEV